VHTGGMLGGIRVPPGEYNGGGGGTPPVGIATESGGAPAA